MELKQGYKQTEVGMIPIDWDLIMIGECLEFKNGLNKEKEYFGQGTPIVNYMDVYKYAGIRAKDLTGLVTLSNAEIKNYEVKKGDVFFTRTSETVDEIGVSTVALDEMVDTVFSGFVLRGRPKNDKIYLEFKKYCFTAAIVRKQIISTASYTTRALTNGHVLSNVLLPLPTKAEQSAIAIALSDIDELISQIEKLIDKKKAIKQGVMQELLKPKEGWVTKKFTDIVDYIHGKAHEQFIVDNGKFKVVNSKFISSNGEVIKYSNNSFLTAKKNDILTVLSDLPNGKALAKCFLVDNDNLYAVNQRVCIWRSKGADSLFLYYLLNRHKYFLQLDDGVTQTHILNGDINRFELTITEDLETQKEIGIILRDIDIEIVILEKKNNKLKFQKQGMMQALLTGKIRLL
jgi:type I restriction enzyme S subunit